jgi:hypothetical protein
MINCEECHEPLMEGERHENEWGELICAKCAEFQYERERRESELRNERRGPGQ